MHQRIQLTVVLSFCFISISCSHISHLGVEKYTNGKAPITLRIQEQVEARGQKWVVSTQGEHTTQIAADTLRQGGNLIDAAIAASFAISVERPHSSGLGGGGFLIYHEAKTGSNHVYDFRGVAPRKAHPKMFLDSNGNVIHNASLFGGLAVGTPALVRGLHQVHRRFGKKQWKALLTPAEQLASNGFKIYPTLAHALQEKKKHLLRFPSTRAIFFDHEGNPKKLGDRLIQADLAKTIHALTRSPDAIYSGEIANKIIQTVQNEGGVLDLNDLKSVNPKLRAPIRSKWKSYEIISMPPPSSGGLHVAQILKSIENDKPDFQSPDSIHLLASSMQSAFADRAHFLGDPDFVNIPMHGLIDPAYLNKRRAEFKNNRARTASEVSSGPAWEFEEESNTTHFSMMDAAGNVVVSTQTINGYFGSGLVAEGTGIVLNNVMDDFSIKAGVPNLFGVTGGKANEVESLKTPLSCMSPTIVFKNKVPVLAVGAPGGTRIITSVAQTILNHLVFGKDLYTSIAAPRIHQQWTPDVLSMERPAESGKREEFKPEVIASLEKMGWKIERESAQSNVMAVSRIQKPDGSFELVGVADPRDIGTSAGE